jgi:type VI secretion system FHA domain protein
VVVPPVNPAPIAAPFADVPVAPAPVPPPVAPSPVPVAGAAQDLADVLAGAGLHGAPVTPELARNLGQILRVVVSGLIDVLHSRQRIKEEFRMRQTIFRPADNNPLKFSANVEDALHNLLVKRNPAYLGAVDAFADAFDDLRDHQLAMLAGMRVAFESMLAESDPDRMQEEFDRQSAKGLIPARLRYWDLYREKRQEMKKDPEATFARLFGEEFARAYEEQFRELRAQRRARAGNEPKDPRPPQT